MVEMYTVSFQADNRNSDRGGNRRGYRKVPVRPMQRSDQTEVSAAKGKHVYNMSKRYNERWTCEDCERATLVEEYAELHEKISGHEMTKERTGGFEDDEE